MGTITGQSLADNAAGLIHDTDKVRWTDTDWLLWLNDGLRETVLVKPEVNVTNNSVTLTASTTKQSLPTGALQLFDIVRNMGSDGATPGRAINVVSRDVLDTTEPNWHAEAPGTEITNYMYDPRDPDVFYVYPPAPVSTHYVELVYVTLPTALTALSEAITIDDHYANALLNYMLFRAYSRDIIYGNHSQESQTYYTLFLSALGVVDKNLLATNPNLTTAAHSSETPATAAKPA